MKQQRLVRSRESAQLYRNIAFCRCVTVTCSVCVWCSAAGAVAAAAAAAAAAGAAGAAASAAAAGAADRTAGAASVFVLLC